MFCFFSWTEHLFWQNKDEPMVLTQNWSIDQALLIRLITKVDIQNHDVVGTKGNAKVSQS